jgi:molybdate transport system substrate-binding protein
VSGRVAGLLVVAAAAIACSGPATSPARSGGAAADLAVYAAASLTAPLESVKAAYESDHPGIRLTLALDSSVALRTQIEQGAPADLFLSADVTNPQKLVDAGLASGPVTKFAGNHLVVVVPKANPGSIETPADLARPGVRIVAAGEKVPITVYTTQLIEQLGAQPGYPADFASAYESNVVSREDNVKAIVTKVELGEADAGIVYVTDALVSDKLATVDVPPAAAVTATYGGVVVGATTHGAQAAALLTWLAGPDGQAILAEFGFVAPG